LYFTFFKPIKILICINVTFLKIWKGLSVF
jgi:hypothetical protein